MLRPGLKLPLVTGCRPPRTVGGWVTGTKDNGIVPSVSVTW